MQTYVNLILIGSQPNIFQFKCAYTNSQTIYIVDQKSKNRPSTHIIPHLSSLFKYAVWFANTITQFCRYIFYNNLCPPSSNLLKITLSYRESNSCDFITTYHHIFFFTWSPQCSFVFTSVKNMKKCICLVPKE